MPSQRYGAKLLTRDEQIFVQKSFGLPQIEESKSAEREAWKDAGSKPDQEAFAQELIRKLNEAITALYDPLKWKLNAKPLPMDSLLGAAQAAKQVVDEAFGTWIANAVMAEADRQALENFTFTTSGQNPTLVDATNAAAREAAGQKVNPNDLVKFLARNDRTTQNLMAAHHFDATDAGTEDERAFLRTVLDEVLRQRGQDLFECDRLGFASTRPGLRKALVSPIVEAPGWELITDQPPMQRRYEVFETLIHEYIHILEHPALPQAAGDNLTIREGVCEWLTFQVISGLMTTSPERLQNIVATVEGKEIPVLISERAENLRKFLLQYKPKSGYTDYVDAVNRVQNICGENGMKASFFQGHMEFIGLHWRAPHWLAGAQERNGVRSIPTPRGGFEPLEKFINATGLSREKLVDNNPGLGMDKPQWPEQIILPGYHSHLTIVIGEETTETWDQISRQHNSTENVIKQVNLLPDPGGVPPGTWLIVPDEKV